jgi:LexA-binding, inner membrane-associated putative hydrolase
MSPVTHFFTGWLLASIYPTGSPAPLTRREKILVVAAAVAPDIDGLGLLPELLTRNSSHPLMWFSQYHHSLHTLAFALVCTLAAFLIASNFGNSSDHPAATHPWLTAALVFISFHLHLLCDLIGARGPDGYQWPIPYLKPFSNAMQLTWQGQWALNGWQNFAFTGLLLLTTLWLAWKYNTSPLELVSQPANHAFTRVLRQRFSAKSWT